MNEWSRDVQALKQDKAHHVLWYSVRELSERDMYKDRHKYPHWYTKLMLLSLLSKRLVNCEGSTQVQMIYVSISVVK